MDAIDIGGMAPIDDDVATTVHGDAGSVQAQRCGIGGASGREQHAVERLLRGALAMHPQPVTRLLDRRHVTPEVQVYARLSVVLGQLFGQLCVEGIEQALAAHEQVDLAAQRLQQAGQFGADVAATDQRHAGRGSRPVEEIVRRAAQLRTRDRGSHRVATSGDQQVARRQPHAVLALDGIGADEVAAHRQDGDAGLVQPTAVALVDVADVALAMGDEGLPVQGTIVRAEAQRAGARQLAGHLGGEPHGLLGHAPGIDAGAAERRWFQQCHASAVGGGAESPGQPAGSAADDDQVEVLLHGSLRWECPAMVAQTVSARRARAGTVKRSAKD